MKRWTLVAALALSLALSSCGSAPEASAPTDAPAVVQVSLPEEPAAPWTGDQAAVIDRNCVACHSPEMIANQPPLAPEKWQATIDKMRTVYAARIDKADDAALIDALVAVQARKP